MALRKNPKRNFFSAKPVTENRIPCAFCGRDVDDELIYGKLYEIGDIQCHYFCVLLSSCLIQKGKDDDGLFGFMYKDILAELERSKKHKCSYCGREGATLGCAVTQCRKQFHLPCGRERNAVSLFYGNYKSFCQMHAHKQKIPDNIMEKAKVRQKEANKRLKSGLEVGKIETEPHKLEPECVCVICYEEVEAFPTLQTFWPPCCARDAWFHRTCIQRMALSAGMHYLKCPLCNDKEQFYEAVIEQGYYVPDRDAAWELEQNAFSEIYERVLHCTAESCHCPMGREHDAAEGRWSVAPCLLCGGAGVHRGCGAAHAPAACRACAQAAGDLQALAAALSAALHAEQSARAASPRRRVMPSRMSLRSTKRHAAADDAHGDAAASRRELNLKPPARRGRRVSEFTSPTKLIEQGFRERVRRLGVTLQLDSVLGEVKQRLRKPKPLSEKRKDIGAILDSMLDSALQEPKQKDARIESCSPRKCDARRSDEEPQMTAEVAGAVEPAPSSVSSVQQQPSECMTSDASDAALAHRTTSDASDAAHAHRTMPDASDAAHTHRTTSDASDAAHAHRTTSDAALAHLMTSDVSDAAHAHRTSSDATDAAHAHHSTSDACDAPDAALAHSGSFTRRPAEGRQGACHFSALDTEQLKSCYLREVGRGCARERDGAARRARGKSDETGHKRRRLAQYVLQYSRGGSGIVRPDKQLAPRKRRRARQQAGDERGARLLQTCIRRFFAAGSARD